MQETLILLFIVIACLDSTLVYIKEIKVKPQQRNTKDIACSIIGESLPLFFGEDVAEFSSETESE